MRFVFLCVPFGLDADAGDSFAHLREGRRRAFRRSARCSLVSSFNLRAIWEPERAVSLFALDPLSFFSLVFPWFPCFSLFSLGVQLGFLGFPVLRHWQIPSEVLLCLFAFKLQYPNAVHFNRGNHESEMTNYQRRGVYLFFGGSLCLMFISSPMSCFLICWLNKKWL